MRTPLAVIAAAFALAAAGCVGGLKNTDPEPRMYRVTAPELPGGDGLAADLLVARPESAPGLGVNRIATRWPGLRFDYYAGARWAEDLPGMVQSALVESLAGAQRLRSVQGDLGRFHATHVLSVKVQYFEADYTAGAVPTARVVLAATLGRQADRRVLASFSVATSQPAAANRLTEVVAALDAAFGRAATEVATRSFDAIAADLQAPANIRP
ncbi:MAG TPA: ABC-type transport auxiliary lipoprotein family protein [Steroidobacteraceae bacterium]|nr:ABC-type transport auxiliary lipoprotein family protein [Steroidobacteraceae bacterium]